MHSMTKYKTEKFSFSNLSGSLEDQLNAASNKQGELNDLGTEIPSIKRAEDLQAEANVEVNNYTDHTTDDLSFELDQINKLCAKTIESITFQIASRQNTGISSEKLEEFREAFYHFDADRDNVLNRLELKSALSSLGEIAIDFEGSDKNFEAIFQELSGGSGSVPFDKFAQYLAERSTDKMDSRQINDAFTTLTDGRQFVTVDDMKKAGIEQDTIDYVTSRLTPTDKGYDFQGYLNSTFSS